VTSDARAAAPPIEGDCDDRFARVRDAFAANFADLDEIGAAVCVAVDGIRVVDLWGGYVDATRTRPWRRDTLVNAYSVGKGVLAVLTLTLVEQGAIDLDAPVACVWPEFGARGKGRLTVRELLAHKAGLPAVRETLADEALYDWDLMCGALAGQEPYWSPGSTHGYHVNTFGYLVGEVVRRAGGERVGDALLRHVTGPLDADFFWGLPRRQHPRVASVVAPQVKLTSETEWARAFPPTGDADFDRMTWHAYFNPSGVSGIGTVNTEVWRLAAIPSTNGHGTARAVAAIYAALLGGGVPGAVWPGAALRAEAATSHADGTDYVLRRHTRYGLGFQLTQPGRPLGPNPGAFGHYGYGGSLGFADPEAGVAFGYLMNRPGERWKTPRTRRLIDAVYACL
jgi:CubicO group peptidase (beta-lactamase class C family)